MHKRYLVVALILLIIALLLPSGNKLSSNGSIKESRLPIEIVQAEANAEDKSRPQKRLQKLENSVDELEAGYHESHKGKSISHVNSDQDLNVFSE